MSSHPPAFGPVNADRHFEKIVDSNHGERDDTGSLKPKSGVLARRGETGGTPPLLTIAKRI